MSKRIKFETSLFKFSRHTAEHDQTEFFKPSPFKDLYLLYYISVDLLSLSSPRPQTQRWGSLIISRIYIERCSWTHDVLDRMEYNGTGLDVTCDPQLKSSSDHLLDLFKLGVVQLLGSARSRCIAKCSPSCQLGFLCRVDLRCMFDSLCPEKPHPQGICQLSYIFITTRHQHLKPYTYGNWQVILSYIHADGTKRRKVAPSISRLHLKRRTVAILQIWTLLYIYITESMVLKDSFNWCE